MGTPFDKNKWTRRDFLTSCAAGAGISLAPAFLAGCGGATARAPMPRSPQEHPLKGSYFTSFGIDEAVLRAVLAKAMSRGGDFADLYFEHKVTNYLGLQDAEVNRAFSEIELGCGIRVLKNDQTGFAFTEDLSIESLLKAAQTAAVVADGPPGPPLASVQRITPPSYYPIETPWTAVGIQQKIPLLERANKKTMGYDKRIIKVQVSMLDYTRNLLLATSEGKTVEDFQPMTVAYVSCVAEHNGRREENYDSYGTRSGFEFYTPERLDALAKNAAEQTVVLFDAAAPPPGELPVVLAPGRSGILLHEAIGHGMEADFNRKGISVYADRIGKTNRSRVSSPSSTTAQFPIARLHQHR